MRDIGEGVSAQEPGNRKVVKKEPPWKGGKNEAQVRASMPGNASFAPGRVIAKIDVTDNSGRSLEDFGSEITIRFRYTRGDKQRADNAGTTLKLGYWDGGKWVVFGSKHKFKLVSEGNSGGYGEVKLTKWQDPHVAWAP